MSKTYDFLKESGMFFVLTTEGGNPQGRPFGAVAEYNHKLYITTATTKNVYRQIKENNRIQIIACKNGTRDWIRTDGKASECFDLAIKAKILEDCPVLKKRFAAADSENFAVFEIIILKSQYNTDNAVFDLED